MKVLDLSYHPLDVRSGKWIDLSRKGNHGVPYGGARPYMIAPGVMGFEFDGNSGYIQVPDNDSLDIIDGITIEAWVNGIYSGTSKGLLNKGNSASAELVNYYVYFNSGQGRFNIGDGTNYNSVFTSQLIDRRWYYIVFVMDSNYLKSYVNGKFCNQSARTINPQPNSQDLLIGALTTAPTHVFNGKVAEVRINNRALSIDEVRENMYRSPIYRMLRGLPHSMIYTKVPWKQTQGGIYAKL